MNLVYNVQLVFVTYHCLLLTKPHKPKSENRRRENAPYCSCHCWRKLGPPTSTKCCSHLDHILRPRVNLFLKSGKFAWKLYSIILNNPVSLSNEKVAKVQGESLLLNVMTLFKINSQTFCGQIILKSYYIFVRCIAQFSWYSHDCHWKLPIRNEYIFKR